MEGLFIDETLMGCIIRATADGLAMAEIAPRAVGVSRFQVQSRELAVLVGLHGKRSGNMTVSLSEATAVFLASRLVGEEFARLDEDVVDAVCEIGNIVAGAIKEELAGTEFEFDAISLPGLVFGAGYTFYHVKNIVSASVTFELAEVSVRQLRDKFFSTSLAFMTS